MAKPGTSRTTIGVLPRPFAKSTARAIVASLVDEAADDLDELHHRRRVEEVEADRALRDAEARAELGDRERRGVRADERVRAEHLEERHEDVELELHVLGDRLDHDVGARAGVAGVGRRGEAIHRLMALFSGDLALAEELLELRADGLHGRKRAAVGGVEEAGRVAALGRDLRDPLAHRPRAEDGDVKRYRNGPCFSRVRAHA